VSRPDSRVTGSRGPHRAHVRGGRPYQARARFSEEEWRAIERAAEESGRTPTAFMAEAAVAAALGQPSPAATLPARELARQVHVLWNQLVHIGTNLNQIAAAINAEGPTPQRLDAAGRWAAHWGGLAEDVGELAAQIRRRL
jgi:hypothetical protein